MRSIIYDQFGGPSVLKMAEVPVPDTSNDKVLVKVKSVSINPLDWKIREGEMKMQPGTKFPKSVGMDFSGIVERAGSAVKNFKQGDEVFGIVDVFKGGALSEFLVASEKDIAVKPGNISFEQAAAMPIVGSAAIQIFEKLVKLRSGFEVLINGASGGIGMFAIQIAKKQGAVITSVVSGKGIELAKKWGSDFVTDYNQTDILESKKQYDVLIDLSGKIPFDKAKKIMKPASTYVNTVPGIKEIIGSFIHNLFLPKKYEVLLLKPNPDYLKTLADYAAKGMDIEVSRTYPIKAFKEAYTEVPKGGILGKAVFIV